jgi:transcription elongation factor Elf1
VPEVTCPNCQTRQAVGDTEGYTCVSCGAAWSFAACENCGVRFHMRPGTTAWTCPECGHENGTATMIDLGAESSPEPEPEPAPEPAEPEPPEPEPPPNPAPARQEPEAVAATTAGPQHVGSAPRATRPAGPPTRARLATIAAIGIAAVLIVAFGLSALGGTGDATAATDTPSAAASTPAPSSSLTPTEQLCLHLRGLQLLRVDNYTRLAAQLANDEAAIQASGDAKLAAAVDRMRLAVIAYKDALAAQGDMTAVTTQLGKASQAMPCS